MTEYAVTLLNGPSAVAGWTGPADSPEAAVAAAKKAHPGTDHLESDVQAA